MNSEFTRLKSADCASVRVSSRSQSGHHGRDKEWLTILPAYQYSAKIGRVQVVPIQAHVDCRLQVQIYFYPVGAKRRLCHCYWQWARGPWSLGAATIEMCRECRQPGRTSVNCRIAWVAKWLTSISSGVYFCCISESRLLSCGQGSLVTLAHAAHTTRTGRGLEFHRIGAVNGPGESMTCWNSRNRTRAWDGIYVALRRTGCVPVCGVPSGMARPGHNGYPDGWVKNQAAPRAKEPALAGRGRFVEREQWLALWLI